MPVDTLGLEVGYRLIPLVDKTQGGELLKRIKGIRKKFAQEVGFLAPPVHIRDNLELKPSAYRITLKGVEVGAGEALQRPVPGDQSRHGQRHAAGPGHHRPRLRLARHLDRRQPARRGPDHGLHGGRRRHRGGHAPEPPDHLARLRTAGPRAKCSRCSTTWARSRRKLVEDLVPKMLSLSTLQKVLQNLLVEGVHIRDMRTIIETLAEHAVSTKTRTS